MTSAIEQTKREMWKAIAEAKGRVGINYSVKDMMRGIEGFESALEAHLEELRKALVAANQLTVQCAQHSAESFVELERRLAAMTEERDSIQLRLHAVDHAYSEQQGKAGTSCQVCADRGASEQPDANMAIVIGAVRGAQDIMVESLVPDGIRAKRAMTKLIPLLDNEKLYSALYELEHAKGES